MRSRASATIADPTALQNAILALMKGRTGRWVPLGGGRGAGARSGHRPQGAARPGQHAHHGAPRAGDPNTWLRCADAVMPDFALIRTQQTKSPAIEAG
jgi:hypothetical protein